VLFVLFVHGQAMLNRRLRRGFRGFAGRSFVVVFSRNKVQNAPRTTKTSHGDLLPDPCSGTVNIGISEFRGHRHRR
jgi:hypothetical protein